MSIDQSLIEQLKEVFKDLFSEITFEVKSSTHQKQTELISLLTDVASSSSKINLKINEEVSQTPAFQILKDHKKTGISFRGIPGGHEFTSLILAVLNTDGKGKYPDQQILNRIKKLKGPINLKTYISLSCENCPDVVQTLNLMALVNPNILHEMVDGEFDQKEVEELKIQGVPSVVIGHKLVSVGKATLIDLLKKLEDEFGVENQGDSEKIDLGIFDTVVIGGGPAGASAAIYSARKGLKTIIIAERFGGQVQDTKGIENLISVPYVEGPELSAKLSQHMQEYSISQLEHRRVTKVEQGEIKNLFLDSGEYLQAKSLIITTGAKWRELGVPGEKQYIGRGVAFCPHCDGPYYKGKKVAVVGGGNSGIEAAIDLAGIVEHVTVFEFAENLKADQVLIEKCKTLKNISLITNARTTQVVGNGEKVLGLEYEERSSGEIKTVDLDGVFVQIGLVPNSGFIKDIVETNKYGEIVVDAKCRTSAQGIYAAGDVTTVPFKQIIIAMGEGAKAALTAYEETMLK